MRKLRVGRQAVSSVIAGIIILTILFSVFTAFVVVGQQNDRYVNMFYEMSQKDIDRFSENITAVYPGLKETVSTPCCQYNMSLSNLGGVGIQIAQIYINTTVAGSSGCTPSNNGPCVLSPSLTGANYTFRTSDSFLNPGEFNHMVRFWLPFSLPNAGVQGPLSPANSISIVTTRGRVFTFQWPFAANPLIIPGFTPNLVRGFTKIAWKGPPDSGPAAGCHAEGTEQRQGPGSTGTLYFVTPWLDPSVVKDAAKPSNPSETIYVYTRLNNTTGIPLSLNSGTIILETADAGSNGKIFFMGGSYIGVYYPVSSTILNPSETIDVLKIGVPGRNGTFIAVFKLTSFDQTLFSGSGGVPKGGKPGAIFLGTAALNNQAEDSTYTGMIAFIDGIYIRPCDGYTNP